MKLTHHLGQIGYLCKQVLNHSDYKDCKTCQDGLTKCTKKTASAELLEMKSNGRLIHANKHFFDLINFVERCFSRYASRKNVFDLTVDTVVQDYIFTFPCKEHAADILAYSIYYYIRLRMRQFTHQENLKAKKQSVVQRKMSKLTNV